MSNGVQRQDFRTNRLVGSSDGKGGSSRERRPIGVRRQEGTLTYSAPCRGGQLVAVNSVASEHVPALSPIQTLFETCSTSFIVTLGYQVSMSTRGCQGVTASSSSVWKTAILPAASAGDRGERLHHFDEPDGVARRSGVTNLLGLGSGQGLR
jgi:hypothetical protein